VLFVETVNGTYVNTRRHQRGLSVQSEASMNQSRQPEEQGVMIKDKEFKEQLVFVNRTNTASLRTNIATKCNEISLFNLSTESDSKR